MRLLCALGLFLALLHVTSCLWIGAFNIRHFGDTKSRNKDVMDRIKLIVPLYDIILIQEVRDSDLTATKRLMDLVNKDSPQFRGISSDYLGPNSYKERYLFLYRFQKVSVTGWFQYNDTAGDFMRPPYAVKFFSRQTAVKEFVLIPIHTNPLTPAEAAKKGKKSTVEEIDALVDVVAAAKLKWTNNNIMVLGDFNAGSNYVKDKKRNNKSDWDDIRLFTNTDFHWLIKDNVGTTTVDSKQVHDRIVVTTDMKEGVVPDSAKVFNFKTYYNLTQDQAEKVSNHFPVEVELKLKLKRSKRVRESDDTSTKDYSVGVFLEPMQH